MPQATDPLLPADFDQSASMHRLSQQAVAWKKRSRKIARLRLLFPALIIGLVVVMVVWIIVQSIINSMNVYNATGDDIRMTNPLYMDRNDNGNRFELRGLEAVRKGRNSSTVLLTAPRLEIRSENNRPSYLEAASGVYDDQKRTFQINKDVRLRSGGGFTLKTQAASVDLQRSVVIGNAPVEGEWASGRVTGQSFRVEDNGNRVIFKGKGNLQVAGTLSGQTAD
ncbi:LPS export ABC transporter periplasmic protein LptC [Asticcacaulis sp. BYS171W]|uniref:LPS export ABC transporter periplasmic protein LptC n=1 Tax=Asticcacaulis aquaticus TaxID=2984212 RepID=A0ABT5HTU0_9CAUL|nr:LPS export ABC transporter periplasmic protein LptC [Asticcacaulis aquaticus]MDC7682896.1 LPS export ABC transporter periplasmic protein LptC [Asticcacaulis aquaticus]